MGKQLFANNATSFLSGILPQGGNTLVCSAGHGSRFPSPVDGDYFLLTLYTKDTYAVEQQIEVVKVTARAGDVMTIERDVELLTGEVGGYAYNGSVTPVFLELRWTALSASNVLQGSDNLASLDNPDEAVNNLGLGNVDNTADLDKPISTSMQSALDGKQVAGSYAAATHTHTVAGVTGLQAALDGKQAAGSYATLAGAESLSNKTLSAPISTGAIYDNGSVRGNIVAVAALVIDCSLGNYFTKTISGASTFTFTNVPASGNVYAFTLELTHTSGTVTWPTSVKWPGDTAPTLTTAKTHLFTFVTDDGGTRWRGVANVNYTN